MKQSTKNKLEEIKSLLEKRDEIDRKLEALVGESSGKSNTPLPSDFSLKDKVFELISNNEQKLNAKDILLMMNNNNPGIPINRAQIASTLAYLKKIGKIVPASSRGFYVSNTNLNNIADNA